MRGRRPVRRVGGACRLWRAAHRAAPAVALAVAWSSSPGWARAGGVDQFWPEAAVYIGLGPQSRLFLNLPYATDLDSADATLDIAAYLDISLLPILRPSLHNADWQRSRYLWARLGVDRIVEREGGHWSVAEDRGIVSLWGKLELPAEVWLESRARADLRWIGGDYSTRYRFRLEATREFTVAGHTVVPYANVEGFYDTRFDQWTRTLYQAGAEITLTPGFRFELYLARQDDHHPTNTSLDALGAVFKWYY